MVVTALGQRFDQAVKVGTAVDDHWSCSTVFQRATRPGRQLGPEIPTDPARTNEAQEGYAGIRRKRLSQLVGFGKEDLTPPSRQTSLVKQSYEIDAGQRRCERRLDDYRTTDGDGRHHLMHDQIQRVVERRDGGDDPDRLKSRKGPPIGARGSQPHGDFSTSHDTQLIGCAAYAVDRTVCFNQRIGQWLAAFARNLPAE